VVPEAFGLTQIAPGVFSDRREAGQRALALAKAAKARSARFFGDVGPDPRLILCTTQACRETFRIQGRGLTLGYVVVLIAPSGLTEATLLHERIHVDLHYAMGITGGVRAIFPSWFNEGLATYLSGTPRVARPVDPRNADWIAKVRTPLDWRRMRKSRRPEEYYAASARLVQEIEERVGRDGLQALVRRVAAGADFDTEYARAMGR
jgi:hypothetical protein